MPRQANGRYTLPEGNPVVNGSIIEADWANLTMDDLAQAISDCLDTNGTNTLKAPIKLVNGTASSPALSFLADASTGIYRDANGYVAVSYKGVPVFNVTPTGICTSILPTLDQNLTTKGYVDAQIIEAMNAMSDNVSQTAVQKSGDTMTGALTVPSITLGSDPTSNMQATTKKYVDSITLASFPSGGIILWSGVISAIPFGWAVCDGTRGTPNLKNRFVMGATTQAEMSETGGANSLTLSIANMPSHNHGGGGGGSGSTGVGSAQIADPAHAHSYTQFGGQPWGAPDGYSPAFNSFGAMSGGSGTGVYDTGHTHPLDFTVTINAEGGGEAFDNRPEFYALAYIMKL